MNKIKVLIVDDEPLAHEVLKGYCERIDFIEIVGHCYDGISTLNFLNKNKTDTILLDIQMPDITGLELLESLHQNTPKVILTTAFTEYAIKGFDYDQVVDYLHKPIRITRFIKAIERVRRILILENEFKQSATSKTENSTPFHSPDFISLRENKKVYRIPYKEIVYIQSWGNYLKFFLDNQATKIIRKTIKEQESQLPEHLFLRIHKSYIVNINRVKALEGNTIILKDFKLPIGKSYLIAVQKGITG